MVLRHGGRRGAAAGSELGPVCGVIALRSISEACPGKRKEAPGEVALVVEEFGGVPTRSVTIAKKRESISSWLVASVMRSVWVRGAQAVMVPGVVPGVRLLITA
jgi:hypothetical protein